MQGCVSGRYEANVIPAGGKAFECTFILLAYGLMKGVYDGADGADEIGKADRAVSLL